MTSLINIAKDNTKPLLIDTSDITGVKFRGNGDNKEVSVYSSKGQLLCLNPDEWNLDAADIMKKLSAACPELVRFPSRWPENDGTFREYDRYINPAAVTFASVSEVREEGHVRSMVGVKGFGNEESYNNTPQEWAGLLAAVHAIKPLLEYKPEEAHARWTNPAALYIDPKSVTRIDGGWWGKIEVHFAQTGVLDVEVKEIAAHDIARALPDAGIADKGLLSEIFKEAKRQADEINKVVRSKFSNELAAANGNLISIPFAEVSTHVSPQDIGYAYLTEGTSETSLIVEPPRTGTNQYDRGVHVTFKTRQEAQKAFDFLTQKSIPSLAASPKAKTPNNP